MFKILSICKGGGYQYCRTDPPHPKKNPMGLYPLHRVLVENRIGRLLESWEHVHHVDEDKFNNADENLEVLTASEHGKHHKPLAPLIEIICHCGTSFYLKPHQKRLREKRSLGPLSCSASCAGKRASTWAWIDGLPSIFEGTIP